MSITLNNNFINFFNEIELKFIYNDVFWVDLAIFFPMLKQGKAKTTTCYNIIALWGVLNNCIKLQNRYQDSAIVKVLNKHQELKRTDSIFFMDSLDFQKTEAVGLEWEDIMEELDLSNDIIRNMSKYI